MSTHADPRAAAAIHFFEQLRAEDVQWMGKLYTEQAFFKDPFNEVHELVGAQRIFAHMFESLDAPRFVVLDGLVQNDQCFLTWDFNFRLKGQTQQRRIHGSSHLRFAADGRIAYHRDYWDAAEEFYEKLPLLGGLLRLIKRRLTVDQRNQPLRRK
ncbi:nuclear transport factor 2 family protein [Roseateles oligotrophus]|uniref:Nuclear transport factor 2 family protein n=1 Tax=Roseateles oligotrophus TaxID=1769250 RepID=A0ABT2YK81_9BURK|nr:nuclear transport factor 2 family protein [Roseateles oligotrophus]MCV2370330.1 nuclear transport factor 2 family protein [Roseateles oligotrophus]